MSNNINVKDASNATVVVGSQEVSSVQWPGHHVVDPTTPTQKLGVNASGQAAVAVADGADVTLGAKADAAASTDTGTFTFIALFKRLLTTYFAAGLKLLALQGAANCAASHVTTSNSASTLAIARPTRRALTIKNLDAAITVYVGPATVSASNGMELKFGESMTVTWVGLVQVISASGTPICAIYDEYD